MINIIIYFIIFLALVMLWHIIAHKRIINGAADIIKNLTKSPRSRSEHAVIKYFEELTHKKFPTVMPDWLLYRGKRLELDGYCKELKIAIEFSGPLHTKWFPGRETYPEYFQRIVKDSVKQKICKQHGIKLIVIDASLPARHWRNYVKCRLYDCGIIEDRPVPYIDEQIVEPFRNKQLEIEYGLDIELETNKI